jgi:hypothetical protein
MIDGTETGNKKLAELIKADTSGQLEDFTLWERGFLRDMREQKLGKY